VAGEGQPSRGKHGNNSGCGVRDAMNWLFDTP
jgi:hypothetical protein